MLCPAFRLRYLFTHLCSCPVSRPAVSENQNGMLAGHAAKCPIYSASRTGIRPFCSNSGLDWKRSSRNNYPLGFDSRCREKKGQRKIPVWNRSGNLVRNVLQHIFPSLASPCAISWRFPPPYAAKAYADYILSGQSIGQKPCAIKEKGVSPFQSGKMFLLFVCRICSSCSWVCPHESDRGKRK